MGMLVGPLIILHPRAGDFFFFLTCSYGATFHPVQSVGTLIPETIPDVWDSFFFACYPLDRAAVQGLVQGQAGAGPFRIQLLSTR